MVIINPKSRCALLSPEIKWLAVVRCLCLSVYSYSSRDAATMVAVVVAKEEAIMLESPTKDDYDENIVDGK